MVSAREADNPVTARLGVSARVVAAPERILVIKSRHIGDVLLTGPLLAALHCRHPQARITLLVKADCATIVQDHPHVQEILIFPQRQAGEGRMGFLLRTWRWFLALRAKRFDWVINTTEGDRGVIAGFLAGAPRRLGVGSRREKRWRRLLMTERVANQPGLRHTVIRNLDLIGAGVTDEARVVHLTIAPEAWTSVQGLLREQGWDGVQPLVQVHPPSRWLFKCWTDSGMAQVIDHIQQQGYRVVLTSGPAAQERRKNGVIVSLCQSPPLDMSGRLSLRQLAALTAHCRLFFGVDTAPAHMAAALDVPVVVLFGPSGTFDWGPWPNGWTGQATPYPRRNGTQQAGPHWVIQKDWDCAPCGRDGCDGSKVSRCLEELAVHEVVPVLDRVLGRLEADGSGS
ncbi:MAG: putative lipopolysaccharide heptosyltransferase III [Magnetococcales bacterium]|nr:putative lipopolysaccharide heptosyltransferase III [Magnetococcales bacterium]